METRKLLVAKIWSLLTYIQTSSYRDWCGIILYLDLQ